MGGLLMRWLCHAPGELELEPDTLPLVQTDHPRQCAVPCSFFSQACFLDCLVQGLRINLRIKLVPDALLQLTAITESPVLEWVLLRRLALTKLFQCYHPNDSWGLEGPSTIPNTGISRN